MFWKAILSRVYNIILGLRKLSSWVMGRNSRYLEI